VAGGGDEAGVDCVSEAAAPEEDDMIYLEENVQIERQIRTRARKNGQNRHWTYWCQGWWPNAKNALKESMTRAITPRFNE
jgi:hypothetical protein